MATEHATVTPREVTLDEFAEYLAALPVGSCAGAAWADDCPVTRYLRTLAPEPTVEWITVNRRSNDEYYAYVSDSRFESDEGHYVFTLAPQVQRFALRFDVRFIPRRDYTAERKATREQALEVVAAVRAESREASDHA